MAPVPVHQQGRERRWIMGYTSKRRATVDAVKMDQVYVERSRSQPYINFSWELPSAASYMTTMNGSHPRRRTRITCREKHNRERSLAKPSR